MRAIGRLGLVVLSVLAFATRISVHAAPGELTTDTLLARWEQAARKHRSLDARFHRTIRDRATDEEHRQAGRFYWEAPDAGFYRAGSSEYLVWNGGKLRMVDVAKKSYREFSRSQLSRVRDRLDKLPKPTIFERLRTAFENYPGYLADAADAIPLVTDMTADTVRKRFDVKWELRNDGLLVTLTPKSPADAQRCSQLDVLLDTDSWGVTAHRFLDPAGNEVIHTFDHVDFDVPPVDRDLLLRPNLDGFRLQLAMPSSDETRSR